MTVPWWQGGSPIVVTYRNLLHGSDGHDVGPRSMRFSNDSLKQASAATRAAVHDAAMSDPPKKPHAQRAFYNKPWQKGIKSDFVESGGVHFIRILVPRFLTGRPPSPNDGSAGSGVARPGAVGK